MNINSFTVQLIGQGGGDPVIAGHCFTLTDKITGQGTHSNAPRTNKIDAIQVGPNHCSFNNFNYLGGDPLRCIGNAKLFNIFR